LDIIPKGQVAIWVTPAWRILLLALQPLRQGIDAFAVSPLGSGMMCFSSELV